MLELVVDDGGELARNINQKKKPDVLQTCRCQLCDKCYRREYLFNRHLDIVYQFDKYDFSCETV